MLTTKGQDLRLKAWELRCCHSLHLNLIASADGIYCFLTKQKAKGILNAEEEFSRLIQRGLKVYL